MKVMTTKGPIELDDLFIEDKIEVVDNARKVATEYRHAGELVRRDVAVSMLMPPNMNAVEGTLG